MTRSLRTSAHLAALLLLAGAAPHAQTPASADSALVGTVDPLTGETAADPSPPYRSLDARATRVVYRIDAPAFTAVMRGVNDAAYPAFTGAAPVAAGIAVVRGEPLRPAVRLAASEAVTLGAVLSLKRVLRRPRPYRAMAEISARDRQQTGKAPADPYSFPSGHAALSFAIATSATLSDGRLAVPAFAWATAVSTARVWHGVHYVSDVLAGAALGAGSAVLVHAVFPDRGDADPDAARVPLRVSMSF